MSITGIASYGFKYELAIGNINLSSDSIKACLMRSGYIFDPAIILYKKNFKTISDSATLTCTEPDQKITRVAGDFIAEGFVIGMRITTDLATNTGPFIITNVGTLELTVDSGLVAEGPTASKIVTGDDELPDGYGYARDTMILSAVNLTSGEFVIFTCDPVSWTTAGGSIGPTPGIILYDDDAPDDPVIGYFDFDGEKEATSDDFIFGGIQILLAQS